MTFVVTVFKSYGPYIFKFDSHQQAMEEIRKHWFSPGVWDITLSCNGEQLDISETVKSWGTRPIYC